MKKVLASLALAVAVTGAVVAAPALADVKAGVDAWARGDWSRAVAEWRPLAIAGDADAQFNLGQAYKLGRGVPIDPGQALAWFKRAADQGHLQAQDNYGIGLFQANRRAEALPFLERSAARGESRAQLVLGTMLFNGDGVKADYPRAYALMTRASQAGLPSAAQSLAQMDGFITPADRDRGLQLAQQYAARDQAVQVGGGRATVAPPREVAEAPPLRPRPQPPPRAQPTPRAAPPRATPAPAAGAWRVQLGAFRDRGNAEALWNRVRARVGGSPAYVAGGGVTRLQATGFASRAAAQAACAKAGTTCVVVAP